MDIPYSEAGALRIGRWLRRPRLRTDLCSLHILLHHRGGTRGKVLVIFFFHHYLHCRLLGLGFTVTQIKKHKMKYFSDIWNWLDIFIIIISLICVGFNAYRYYEVLSVCYYINHCSIHWPDLIYVFAIAAAGWPDADSPAWWAKPLWWLWVPQLLASPFQLRYRARRLSGMDQGENTF